MTGIIPFLVFVFTLLIVSTQQQLVDSLVLTSSGTGIVPGPKIQIYPESDEVYISLKHPEEKVIGCTSVGDDPKLFNEFRWVGPKDAGYTDKLNPNAEVVQIPFENTLTFKRPSLTDNGLYECIGTYQGGDRLTANISVIFYYPIEVQSCQERQFVIKGSNSPHINCHIVGEGTMVTISKDGRRLIETNSRYKGDHDGLVINGDVVESDAGVYLFTAYAKKSGQNVQRKIVVEVLSYPEILPIASSDGAIAYHGVEGESTQLKCDAQGNPKPLVTWLDPLRRNLTQVGGYLTSQEQGTLTIQKINKQFDHGLFECVAYNSIGQTSRNVSMYVDTRPNIVSFINKTVDEGAEVEFECRSTGEPEPKFSIRRGGINQQPYHQGDGFFRRERIDPEGSNTNVYVHRLSIIADRNQYGLHYCNATNRAGTAEQFNQLFVNYKPDLSLTPAIQYVKQGGNIVVTCTVKAFPPPVVTLWADGSQVLGSPITQTSPDGQIHTIKFSPPNPQQLAFTTFLCKAVNKMGLNDQTIRAEYITRPGLVTARLMKQTPTTVELVLSVPNDGGDRIRHFIYSVEGSTLDNHNPTYSYHKFHLKDVEISSTGRDTDVYTIRNLLPYYNYRMHIRAANDVGLGDTNEVHFHTIKPTRPEPPVVIRDKIGGDFAQHSTAGIQSEYSNAYELKWSYPELDNGDPVIKYIIKVYAYDNSANVDSNLILQRTVEQMSDKRPTKATLGPLEADRRYKIEIQAINNIAPSEAASIIVYTKIDRPALPEFGSQTLPWLTQPTTPTLAIILVLAVVLLIVIDLVFCSCCQIGISYKIRSLCCRSKTNSVKSDTVPVQSENE